MKNSSWDDFRIALQVAQSGTLTKAGTLLQMNHTTVQRHINQLEKNLGLKLFIRHQRGYKLTEAGNIVLKEVPKIDLQVKHLINQLGNIDENAIGHLKITTLSDYSSILNPALKIFRESFPNTRIQIFATEEIIPLESGSVHVSLRAGRQPTGADIIAKKIMPLNIGYYASDDYISHYGLPQSKAEFSDHLWAMPSIDKHHIPFIQNVLKEILPQNIIYQSNYFPDIHQVVTAGMAIGSMAEHQARPYNNLVKIPVELDENEEKLWFVYHRDLKNSKRIKALYTALDSLKK